MKDDGKPVTASELLARLQSSPEWVRQNAEREARRKSASQELQSQVAPEQELLVRDLSNIGLDVRSIWDLVNMSAPYPAAVPVLLQHLRSAHHPVLRNGIARALAVQEAAGVAGGPILEELMREDDPEVRWALANTLTIVADKKDRDAIFALVTDPHYRDVRERLQQALNNSE